MGGYYANLTFVNLNLSFYINSNPWLFLEGTVPGLAVTISHVPRHLLLLLFFSTEVAVCFCPLQRECFC